MILATSESLNELGFTPANLIALRAALIRDAVIALPFPSTKSDELVVYSFEPEYVPAAACSSDVNDADELLVVVLPLLLGADDSDDEEDDIDDDEAVELLVG